MNMKLLAFLFLPLFTVYSICSSPKLAFAIAQTADETWASAATQGSTSIPDAAAGDTVEFDTNPGSTLTVTNNGTADDGGGLNLFTIGAITETTGDGDIDITSGSSADLNVDIASVSISGPFIVRNVDGDDSTVDVDVAGALTVGGAVSVTNTETTTADTVSLDVDGNYQVTGATTITAGGFAGADSSLNLAGADIDSGSFTLDDAIGTATLTFDGGAAQDVTGAIDGAAAGEGTLSANAGGFGTTFNSAIGSAFSLNAVNVDGAGIADFNSTVAATTIAQNSTGKANFDGAVTATSLNITSTGEVELNAASAITTTTFTGAGLLDVNATLTGAVVFGAGGAGTVTVADGTTITGSVTTTVDGQGTLTSEGTSTFAGAIGGAGFNLAQVNGGADTFTTTFSSAVFADALNVTGTGEVELDTASTIGTSTIDTTGTLDIDATLTGDVSYAGNGTVDVATGTTIAGATTTTADGQGTLNFEGTHSTGGLIGAVGGNALLALNVVGGTLTMSHNIAADTVTVDSGGGGGGTLTLDASRLLHGSLTLAATGGTLNLAANTLTMSDTGVYTQNAGSTLNITIPTATTSGGIVASGAATVAAGSTINLTVTTPSSSITSGTVFTPINATGAGAIGLPTITDTDPVWNFKPSTDGEDLFLTAILGKTFAGLSGTGNVGAVARVIDELIMTNSGDSDMRGVLASLIGLSATSSNETIIQALQQLLPLHDGSVVRVSFSMHQEFLDVLSGRLEVQGLRGRRILGSGESEETGVATGEHYPAHGIWARGYGSYLEQDAREGVGGYNARIFGPAVGYDFGITENVRAGAGFSYGHSDINSELPNAIDTDIDSFQWGIYGSYDKGAFFIDGIFAYAWNTYDASRRIVFPGVNRQADSDYDGHELSFRFNTGYTVDAKGFELTPIASFRYSHLGLNSYTEEGAGALNLSVDDQDYDLAETGFGIKVARPIPLKQSAVLTPEIHFMWFHDYVTDRVEMSSRFSGGGGSFTTLGFAPDPNTYNLGGSLTFFSQKGVTLTGNYDAELREDFYAHHGSLTASIEF